MSLALSGDLVLAAESARFTTAYTAVGLAPDGGTTHLLPRLVGLRRSQELLLTNRRLSAREALEWGLVSRVVPDEALASEADQLARQLAAGPTRAFGAVRALLAECFERPLAAQLEAEARAIAEAGASADAHEGITAFLEKRVPRFHGR